MTHTPPRLSPIEGVSLGLRMMRDPYGSLETMYREHGPVVDLGYGKYRYVYLFGREANETVLHTQSSSFSWRDAFWPLAVVDGETALVVSDGEDHRRRRAIVQPAFHLRRISSYLSVMANETTQTLNEHTSGETFDAYESFRLTIRRIVIRCLFGDDLAHHHDELGAHLDIAIAYANRLPTSRIDVAIPGLPYRGAVQARRAADTIVYDEIERRRSVPESTSTGDDVLGWLLEHQEGEAPLTDQEVRDQVVSLVAAGYDTTAAAMGWAVAELATDPTHQNRIREEYESVTAGGPLTIEHIPRLTYANAFISEVLRLHPPAMLSGRRVERPFTLHGFTVPAGRMILYSPYITHRIPELFPDPEAFKPGRWIEGHPDHHQVASYAYVPFGGGNRRCIGFAFALQELVVMITALAARAAIEPAFELASLRPTGLVSSRPANGVPIRLQPL